MVAPRHRVRNSGSGGSGYKNPVTGEVTPGVTTVLKQAGNDALIQWSVDQVSAWAVANVDALLNRTTEQGWGYLRYYHKRTPDLESDPLRSAHKGVLNDLAEIGTNMHDYLEWAVTGRDGFAPDLKTRESVEMAEQVEEFLFLNEVIPLAQELTVWGDGYTGTLDGIYIVNGVPTLLDTKTSRNIHNSHKRQLSALHYAPIYDILLDTDGNELDSITQGRYTDLKQVAKTDKWEFREKPQYEAFGFIHMRPSDYDNKGNYVAPFCRLEPLDAGELPIHHKAFRGFLAAAQTDKELKQYLKDQNKEEPKP